MKRKTLSPELLQKMDDYWRAANYVSVGRIYLCGNPLLKRPLTPPDVKHMLLGALGHDPGAELHLRALEPGHQKIRPEHDLRLRPRARRSGRRGQQVSRNSRNLRRSKDRRTPIMNPMPTSPRLPNRSQMPSPM